MAISPIIFRDAMARLGAAVNIVTTDGVAGRYGVTVSAVCSLTDEPPTLLVCINRRSRGLALFRDNAMLCVNILGADHAAVSARFAGGAAAMDDRFGDPADWVATPRGLPALRDAVAALECRIVDAPEIGTHAMLRCEVEDARFADRMDGLIYFGRAYHGVSVPVR